MKYFGFLLSVAAGLAWCNTAPVSYAGYQTIRVATGENGDRVADLINRLRLETWKHTASFADVVVPPEKISLFNAQAVGLDATIMHEDLGASIAEEAMDMQGKRNTTSLC